MMLECLVDGEISTYVSAANRGLCYGDGVFETIPVHHGRPRRWQSHMDRLGAGCERLGLGMPPQAVLLREVQTVTAGLADAVVKIILTRDGQGRGYLPPEQAATTRVVSAHPYPADVLERARSGVTASICNLRLGIQPALGGIKHLNRLEQVMAAAEIREKQAEEGIMLDAEDHVICALAGNVFIVFENRLLTPRLDRCGVRGVLRSHILGYFGARCEQRRIMVDMLAEADEVFICSSVRGIVPVRSIDQYVYGIGPVTHELQTWLLDGSR